MVWLLLGIVVWTALIYLVGPLLRSAPAQTVQSAEVRVYQDEIARLSREIDAGGAPELESQKIELQRQLLSQSDRAPKDTAAPPYIIINSLFVFFVFGGIALYNMLGSPELTKKGALKTAPIVAESQRPPEQRAAPPNDSLDSLLMQLKSKLDGERKGDPAGWMLYARTLMNMGRFEEAFQAYETALPLTDNDPDVIDELARARDFAVMAAKTPPPVRGPSAEDMEAAADLSPNERQAMIENMVSGLATRLRGNPEDPEGWIRLLKARKVLGQSDQAETDIELIKKTFARTPEVTETILKETEWQP